MNDTDRQAEGAKMEKWDTEDTIQEDEGEEEGETETQEPKVREKREVAKGNRQQNES